MAFISHQRDGGETSVGISDIADARRASGKVTNPVFFQSFSSSSSHSVVLSVSTGGLGNVYK